MNLNICMTASKKGKSCGTMLRCTYLTFQHGLRETRAHLLHSIWGSMLLVYPLWAADPLESHDLCMNFVLQYSYEIKWTKLLLSYFYINGIMSGRKRMLQWAAQHEEPSIQSGLHVLTVQHLRMCSSTCLCLWNKRVSVSSGWRAQLALGTLEWSTC